MLLSRSHLWSRSYLLFWNCLLPRNYHWQIYVHVVISFDFDNTRILNSQTIRIYIDIFIRNWGDNESLILDKILRILRNNKIWNIIFWYVCEVLGKFNIFIILFISVYLFISIILDIFIILDISINLLIPIFR